MKRGICAWLALLAFALNALSPLHASAQPKSLPAEICSSGGAKAITGAGRGQDSPVPPAHHDDLSACCLYCEGAANDAPLVPAPVGLAAILETFTLPLACAQVLSWRFLAYLPVLSRGPPALQP